MSNVVIENVEKEAEDFINNNNIFLDVGDPYSKFVYKGIEGISTWGIPNVEASIKKVKSKNSIMYPGQVLYDTKYTFDYFGRRTTLNLNSNKSKVSIFFGDSMTFGEGLPDSDTIPSLFSKYNEEYYSYNYGFLGHGPSHMLVHLLSKEFREKFKDKKGKIFYIYRDDAIRVCTGQVAYNNLFPKFEYQDSVLKYKGSYNSDEGYPKPLTIPTAHTQEDYRLIVGIFSEAVKAINEISTELEFNVVILPLSFTHKLLENKLKGTGIKVHNLYRLDLAYHTGNRARFLDGIHTKFSNEVLIKRLNLHLSGKVVSYKTENIVKYKSIQEVIKAVELETFMLPVMQDFPHDDASVITALILHNSEVEVPSDIDFLEIARKQFLLKKELIENLTFKETKDELKTMVPLFTEIPFALDLIYNEYYNLNTKK